MSLLSNKETIGFLYGYSLTHCTRGEVKAEVFGIFGVHPQHSGTGEKLRGFSITHVPSGLSVWKTKTEAEALRIALWLEQHNPIPPEAQTGGDLFEWKHHHPEAAKALGEQLDSLGKKWCGKKGAYL